MNTGSRTGYTIQKIGIGIIQIGGTAIPDFELAARSN